MRRLLQRAREDLERVFASDPAARSRLEVVLCYPGLHAVWSHHLTSWLWKLRFFLAARLLSQLARWLTGIEIHPGAVLGRRLFLDHGMGIVIGETAIVGDDVTLYQGVTLGGTGKDKGRRHPTLGNGVIVGAGAHVLGSITVGDNCRIGAGSVVLRSVPPNSTIVGVPGHLVLRDGKRVVISDPREIRDPLSDAVIALAREVDALRARLDPSPAETVDSAAQPFLNEDLMDFEI